MNAMILVHTVEGDLHALEVRRRILTRGYKDCFIFESNRIAGQQSISFEIGQSGIKHQIRTQQGNRLSVGRSGIIWFRRCTREQFYENELDDPVAKDLIDNECRETAAALFETEFCGKWISKPHATIRASNKLVQLVAASECGFRIPDSIITQSKPEVLDFNDRHRGKVIVKAISGTSKRAIETRLLTGPAGIDENSYISCPALYQEFIPGTRHIRLHCFGQSSHAAVMETPHVDSRIDLNAPIDVWPVPAEVHRLIRRVLDELCLEMGIVDLKETPDGELVWLEVNPQGQFLFLEALSDLKIGDIFVEYLLEEARLLR